MWVSLLMSFQMLRTVWVLNWPGQVTIAGCQTYWTMEVAEALEAGNIKSNLFPQLSEQVELKQIGAPHTLNTPHPVFQATFSCIKPGQGQRSGPRGRSDSVASARGDPRRALRLGRCLSFNDQ